MAVDLNGWFDRIPRLTVDVGHRRLPVFRSFGVIGFQFALTAAVLVSLLNGVSLATALGMSAVAGLSFFAWGLLRRAVTGRETLVLFEYVWVAFGAAVGFLWLAGGPIVAGLDAMAVALCAFLACGRLGCAAAGCCHGVLARTGIVYGPEYGLPPRLTGRRLLPVQLFEAAGLTVIGLVGLALVGGPAGRPTVWFLVAYAVLRFGCEALRGDRRPTVVGLSVPRVMCAAQVVAAVVAAEWWLEPEPAGRALVAGGVALAVAALAGISLTVLRGRNPLVAPEHLDEVWEVITTLGPRAPMTDPHAVHTSRGMTVAVTRSGEGLHVSLSHPERPTFPVGVALRPDAVIERSGITHLALQTDSSALAHTDSAPPVAVTTQGRRGAMPNRIDDQDTDYFARPSSSGAASHDGATAS
ncbi:prolipoprotein diacylglyceryl transferase family protein [Rhodococcus sp. T7]|uniref:prolipoprotein diacylglyceryl transferase family protein n=1 Tax=Rhodococcus sp. T7 TaxID=627444 RepID=UPI0013574B0A|nr:prolipoprotein diacylglyceryl transferase family protein [Rhodococcus sp. T7]KAF0956749.1 Prolipoprotein diacylglyceryl transferase [Rhodococcus sp. T7]KAF0966593.1 Prolipoprotein diacylglyceryl transferase [Rhodococcus sp. T7]